MGQGDESLPAVLIVMWLVGLYLATRALGFEHMRTESDRAVEDQRLVAMIRGFHAEADGVYGSPRIFRDLREAGETCGLNRVARLMREHRIRAVRGYKAPRHRVGRS